MDESNLVTAVSELGGIATTAMLMKAFSRKDLRVALESGHLNKIGRGLYAVSDTEGYVVAARSAAGVVSGLSAARWWRWAVKFDPVKPVVTVQTPTSSSYAARTCRPTRSPDS